MTEPTSISDADQFSVNRLSRMTGFDRRTVSRRLEHVQPTGIRAGHPVYSLRDAGPALYAVGYAGDDPEQMGPKDRLDWYRGESEKRKLQKTDGELVEASVYERHMADLLKVSVSWAETFTDVMEREAGLTPEQLERVQTAVDRQRDRLHKSWGPADV